MINGTRTPHEWRRYDREFLKEKELPSQAFLAYATLMFAYREQNQENQQWPSEKVYQLAQIHLVEEARLSSKAQHIGSVCLGKHHQ